VIPVFVILVAAFLALVPIITDPSPKYLLAVFFILAGVAVYVPFVYYRKYPKIMGKSTAFH
jgi:L-type amino acid transporter 9